jgi:hypothetical protein
MTENGRVVAPCATSFLTLYPGHETIEDERSQWRRIDRKGTIFPHADARRI